MRTIQEMRPKDLDVRLALGNLYTTQKKYGQAITAYESALPLAPNPIPIYTTLIALHNQENQFPQAVQACDKLESLLPRETPTDANVAQYVRSTREFLYLHKGRAYLGQGDYLNATEPLQRLIDLTPKSAIGHYRLGLAYAGSKNYIQAITEYKRALQLDPTLTTAQLKLANAYIAQEEYTKAIGECEQIIATQGTAPSQNAEAYYLAGVSYLGLGNYQKALNQLQEALKRDPDAAESYVAIGNLYRQQKQFDSAMRYYQMAIGRNSNTASAHQGLASVYALTGNTAQAIAEYNQVITLNPNAASPYNDLAWYYATQGTNLDTALEIAKKAVTMEPQSPIFRDTLGWVYYKKGMYREAITELTTATMGTPKNPFIHYHLGMAYYANKEVNNAKQALQASLNISADFPNAAEAKKLIQQIEGQ